LPRNSECAPRKTPPDKLFVTDHNATAFIRKEFSMARLLPRKRTIIGGTLAVGLVAGIWLAGKLPHTGSGFGLGSGGDTVLGQQDTSNSAAQAGDGTAKSDSISDSDEHSQKPKRTDPEPLDDVLTILVDGRHYSVWRKTRNGNGYFLVQLDELISLGVKTKSNGDGIRVRILRSESARVTAWQRLQSELVQAGVPAETIVLTKDLVK
jgi:hypothetical protein